MRAAILSIGSELLHGFLTDTNATFLTQELNALGIEVTGVFQVGDDLDRIVTTFRRALSDADLVVASGGIGPTEDDLTREAIAEIAGETPTVDERLADGIRDYFQRRGVVMPEQNVKQAWLIPSAESLDNPMGTAPGWFVGLEGRLIVAMPGVPREMYRMWQEQAVPRILGRLHTRAIVSTTLKTSGIGESAVEHEILDIVHRGAPVVATYAKDDGVHIRISMISDDRADAELRVQGAEAEIRARIGEHVYGYLDDSLPAIVLAAAARSGGRVAVWEAGNGARFADALLDAPNADDTIAAATEVPWRSAIAALAVDDEVEAVARAGAVRAREVTAAEVALAVATRIDPGETADRDRGQIAIAIARGDEIVTRQHQVSAIPREIRRRATMWALDFAWRTLRDA